LADILGLVLEWSDVLKQQEISRTIDSLRDKHGVSPEILNLPSSISEG